MTPANAIPDFTAYGLLAGNIAVVFIFLLFGVLILRYAFAQLRAMVEENARRHIAREEVLTRALAETNTTLRQTTSALTDNAAAYREATGAFRKVDETLIRLGGTRP